MDPYAGGAPIASTLRHGYVNARGVEVLEPDLEKSRDSVESRVGASVEDGDSSPRSGIERAVVNGKAMTAMPLPTASPDLGPNLPSGHPDGVQLLQADDPVVLPSEVESTCMALTTSCRLTCAGHGVGGT